MDREQIMIHRIAIFFTLACLSFFSSADSAYGKYSGNVKAEWLDDGRQMKLLESFSYEDPNGMNWLAPKGTIVDGASIPTFAWSFIGSPFSGKYRNASVIHDTACQEKQRTWETVHLSFYYGMLASQVNKVKAKVMYAAVYHFGPRWPVEMEIENPRFNKDSDRRFICHPSPLGKAVCTSNPLYDPRPEITVNIPAPEKLLSLESFDNLVSEIAKGEEEGKPLSIEEISNWQDGL